MFSFQIIVFCVCSVPLYMIVLFLLRKGMPPYVFRCAKITLFNCVAFADSPIVFHCNFRAIESATRSRFHRVPISFSIMSFFLFRIVAKSTVEILLKMVLCVTSHCMFFYAIQFPVVFLISDCVIKDSLRSLPVGY